MKSHAQTHRYKASEYLREGAGFNLKKARKKCRLSAKNKKLNCQINFITEKLKLNLKMC